MHYTHVLYRESDREWCTGETSDLKARVREHAEGRVRSTAPRGPLVPCPPENILANFRGPGDYRAIRKFRGAPSQAVTGLAPAYYEACLNREDAFRRERHLKSGRGKRCLKQRLGQWRVSLSRGKLERC